VIESAFGGTKWFALNVNDAMATSLSLVTANARYCNFFLVEFVEIKDLETSLLSLLVYILIKH